ncbi:MAG: AAA family ATPase, partial [Actinomycetota bacterium]|nr:AAA family ATPase [Actinomycetota bacterium]
KAFLDAGGGAVQPLVEAISGRKKEIERRVSELSGAIEPAWLTCEKKREEFSSALEEIKQLRTKRGELEATCEELLQEKSKLLASRADLICRLYLLSRLETRRWTFLNTISELLERDFGEGKLGEPLIHELDIDSSFEKAVMDFLGPWAFALPVKGDETVIAAIRYLKERGAGKALFFREGEGNDTEFTNTGSSLSTPPGAVPALEAVRAPARFMDALRGLLADTYIVGSLEEAFSLAHSYPRFTFLTPDGDVISGGTFLRGGSPTLDPLLLETSKRRREEMESSIEEIQVGLDEICLRIERVKGEIKRLDERLESAGEALSRCFEESAELHKEHSLLSGRAEVFSQELAYLEGLDLPPAPAGKESLGGKLAKLLEQEVETRGELDRIKAERAPLSREEGKLREDISATEREIAIIAQRQRKIEYLLRTPEGGLADGSAWVSAESDVKKIVGFHERLVSLADRARQKLREDLSSEFGEEGKADQSIDRLKVEILRLEEEKRALEDKIHSQELSSAEVKVKLEQVAEKITKTHGVSLEFALKTHDPSVERSELERRIEELGVKLERLGPVNPEAISQLRELEERHDFFKSQVEDLREGKLELQKVVREVDNQIKERFLEAFDEANTYFRGMFSFLFPNGKAELKLSEPDDALNSGVEIFAQPEGKRLRRLSLLSGGETSLTALAFFFALFKVRPSPFYFLDEVEAALDDINLERFLELVKEFREESQLIIITHQRKSMEIGDALYGVTMHEDGISRAVSQRIAV